MFGLILAATALCLVVAVALCARLGLTARDAHHAGDVNPDEREDRRSHFDRERHAPIAVEPLSRAQVELNTDDVAHSISKLRLDRFAGLSMLLHSAMVFGLDMEVPEYPSGGERPTLSEVLFQQERHARYFASRPVFIKTPWGLRNRTRISPDAQWQIERQAHPGQLLAALAKHGVSLEQKLTTDAGVFTVRDLLRDTIANYDDEEPQIEWICIALALYSPPRKAWVDKNGHRFSFDDLARDLLNRNLDSSERPCDGIHLLESLVVFLRVDAEHDILSSVLRREVQDQLKRQVIQLTKTQLPDGSWPTDWRRDDHGEAPAGNERDARRRERVHITGHHVDWMLLLPPDMMPPDRVFQRAASWLLMCLLEWDEQDLARTYCPYSHAAHVLNVLGSEAPPP